MPRIFISYSHVDILFVNKLVEALPEKYDVWVDRDLKPGEFWQQKINDQIVMCDIFLYVLTNESVESSYCQQEFILAKHYNKVIIPVIARDRTRLTSELSEYHYIDMLEGADDEASLEMLFITLDPNYVHEKKKTKKHKSRRLLYGWLIIVFSILGLILSVDVLTLITETATRPIQLAPVTPIIIWTQIVAPTMPPTPELNLSLYQPIDREEALAFSGFWQQVDFVDLTEPDNRQYDVVVHPEQPLRATFNWCADTVEHLDEILLATEFQFTLDDRELSESDFLLTYYMETSDYICQNWDVIIEGWLPGRTVSFTIQYVINEDIYDGYATYLAGEYNHEIRIHPGSNIIMCRGSVPSQLTVGENARITPGGNSRLRDTPSRTGRSATSATEGGLIEVVSGPVCEGNHIWWRVYYDTRPYENSSNMEEYYWIAEATSLTYYVEPLLMPVELSHNIIVPIASNLNILSAYQEFERGHMFWLQSLQQVWVLHDSGLWQIFQDKETPADWQTINVDRNSPDGLFEPESGFEIVWEMNQDVLDSLGWAIAPEIGFSNQLEYSPFEGAITLQDDKGNRYYLYANFQWEQRPPD